MAPHWTSPAGGTVKTASVNVPISCLKGSGGVCSSPGRFFLGLPGSRRGVRSANIFGGDVVSGSESLHRAPASSWWCREELSSHPTCVKLPNSAHPSITVSIPLLIRCQAVLGIWHTSACKAHTHTQKSLFWGRGLG